VIDDSAECHRKTTPCCFLISFSNLFIIIII
jgi:hypothetical protein